MCTKTSPERESTTKAGTIGTRRLAVKGTRASSIAIRSSTIPPPIASCITLTDLMASECPSLKVTVAADSRRSMKRHPFKCL
uniref:Uncharacterized protein n=1 Tax=Ascaris lumbricoides TaxID=6252 RepID=A0A0M3I3C4_ASCLU